MRENGNWIWQGDPVEINGEFQGHAVLQPGTTLKLGGTEFLFQTRTVKPTSNETEDRQP